MSDLVTCNGCGAEGHRMSAYPAPENWFFVETKDAETPGESWYTYACGVKCRDEMWQVGPGESWAVSGSAGSRTIPLVWDSAKDGENEEILDDDSQFVADALAVYGNTVANDTADPDEIAVARRIATCLKAGTLRLVFHDDLEELAGRLRDRKEIVHMTITPIIHTEDEEWLVMLSGDGWEVASQKLTLTEAADDAFVRVKEEGSAHVRAFAARCRKLGLGKDDAYLLAIDALVEVNPETWEALWSTAGS